MKRYHKDIWLPDNLIEECKQLVKTPKKFSLHAYQRLNSKDRSHKVDRGLVVASLKKIQKNPPEPFEVYTNNNGKAEKFCMRGHYKKDDIIFVFTKKLIVTFWLNDKNDSHKTLDEELYERKGT